MSKRSMDPWKIRKSTLAGQIVVPPSKSQTLRAILFGTLASGTSRVSHFLPSPDAQAMIEACRHFGARIEVAGETLAIQGVGGRISHTEDVIHAGNSGIVLRFCAAVGSLGAQPVVVTGDYSIRHQRPMKPLLEGLSQLGVSTVTMRGDGYAPVILQGPLKSGFAEIDGQDSQPVSALLIAAAFAEGPIKLNVRRPGELPWVAMTLNWFDQLGISYINDEHLSFYIRGPHTIEGFDYHVPGDFSSAAFPIAAALITGSELTLKNLDMNDPQGDKKLIGVFQKMGAHIEIDEEAKTVHVRKCKGLQGISVDINDCIDAITILAVVACYAEGETEILNCAVARQKECDRIACIVQELRKMGAEISEIEQGLRIRRSDLTGALVDAHGDHRMAMSLAVAGLGARGNTLLSSADCVSKTYPPFLADFQQIGAQIQRAG